MKKEKDMDLPPVSITIDDEGMQAKLEKIVQMHPEQNMPGEKAIPYTWDEAGFSSVFAELYMSEARYCPEMKCWYAYNGERWIRDEGSLEVSSKIKEFYKILLVYALYCVPKEDSVHDAFLKLVNRMGDRRWRDRLLKDIADAMRISVDQFDAKPYLINCKNGTYDLETETFREHSPADLLTMQTAFRYTASEDRPRCHRWETFIDEVTQNDKEKAKYLQKALGYSMLGLQKEECMFILHGKTTRNGKSTLLAAVHHLLGDYADVVPVEMICKRERTKDPDAPNTQLAKLKGKRFVTMSESDSSGRLDESAIKQYTGGESITTRGLYQKSFSFTPQFTMWMSCNDLPSVRDKSIFASERLNVITFDRHFSQSEQDKNLKTYFESQEAMQGIFTWLLDGFRMYVVKKLVRPESVKAAVREYERDNDLIQQFLEEKCEATKDYKDKIQAKDLYDRYKIWCKSNGYFICTVRKFNAELTAHPEWYEEKSKTMGMVVYRGLRLKGKVSE